MTVYFARVPGARRVKIGYVMDDCPDQPSPAVLRRLAIIRKKFGALVYLAATAEGRRWVELWFHRRHQASALGREWFRETALLSADIACLASGGRLRGQPRQSDAPSLNYQTFRTWRRMDHGDRPWWSHREFSFARWHTHMRRLSESAA